jgi:hypothetical protein
MMIRIDPPIQALNKRANKLAAENNRLARSLWPMISKSELLVLKRLTVSLELEIRSGELLRVNGAWYVSHSGLLKLATRQRCFAIHTQPVLESCDLANSRWIFKAIAFKSPRCKGFIGYGDADPSNVSALLHGAEMRVAETRAVNRALRKAYGIGICSVEEIGSFARPERTKHEVKHTSHKLPPQAANGKGGHGSDRNGSRLRDRLCQLIRQHSLDAELVKSYAVDFCGTKSLRDATREQVENFIVHLADWAEKDRNALLCQLNSYSRPQAGAA